MDILRITGGSRLHGEISISGAKNAALPILCAGLLTADTVTLTNVPELNDISTTLKLLGQMGVRCTRETDGTVHITANDVSTLEAPYELVKTMRASILVLGPLLARFGQARVSLPGGCAIGQRPVDQHIHGLAALGADISIEHGFVVARGDDQGLVFRRDGFRREEDRAQDVAAKDGRADRRKIRTVARADGAELRHLRTVRGSASWRVHRHPHRAGQQRR